MPAGGEDFEERVRARLARPRRRVLEEDPELVRAAVLFPLLRARDGYHVLLTVRSGRVGAHRGEIGFPGGKVDPSDHTLLGTALREAEEELGLDPGDVDLLGALDDRVSNTGFLITAFVGAVDHPYAFVPSQDEVDAILEVPLDDFREPDAHQVDASSRYRGRPHPIHYYRVGSHVVWGVTGGFVHTFLERVYGPGPDPS